MTSNRKTRSLELRQQILFRLADGQFHSGEDLGQSLNVTRATISQHIKELRQSGLDIFCVTGKGYKLSHKLTLLDKAEIEKHLAETVPIHIVNSVDSTNSWLLRAIPSGIASKTCCLAEMQTAGRGRRGREWLSPLASHLYFSMYFQLATGIAQTMGLSLVVGIAIVNTLNKIGVAGAKLKWPNDVLVDNKKLAGVLVEIEGQTDGPCELVIGIGINVNMPRDLAAKIDQPWIDLYEIWGEAIDRNKLAAELINQLLLAMADFQAHGFSFFKESWNQQNAFADQSVALIAQNKTTTGICRGVDNTGAIQLALDGLVKSYVGGELSLRLTE